MEKSKPMELGLGELLSNENIVNNNSFRFINRDIGIVVSFAQMDSILFSTGKPYRTRESRIIRILKGEARISINLIEYKVKEPMIIISPFNSLIEIVEISEDYDFQVIVPDNNFLPIAQGSALTGRTQSMAFLFRPQRKNCNKSMLSFQCYGIPYTKFHSAEKWYNT